MTTSKGTWKDMGDELIHKRGEGLREFLRGDPRGEHPCILFEPIFLNFLYEPPNFLLSVPKENHWIHVRGWVWVVTSHSYWENGGWVQSTWGRCKSKNESHKKEICMGWDNSQRGEERELGVGVVMEGEFWSIDGA